MTLKIDDGESLTPYPIAYPETSKDNLEDYIKYVVGNNLYKFLFEPGDGITFLEVEEASKKLLNKLVDNKTITDYKVECNYNINLDIKTTKTLKTRVFIKSGDQTDFSEIDIVIPQPPEGTHQLLRNYND